MNIIKGSIVFLALVACSLPARAESPQEDPALIAPPINTAPGAQYKADTREFQGIPGIERAANGRLWALWYGGGKTEGPENYVMVTTSADDGKTWTDLSLVIDPPGPVRAYDPCLWHDPTGKLWLFWAQSYEWWDGRSGVWAITTTNSGDAEPTWTAPQRISDGILMNKPTVLKNGEWLMPVSYWSIEPRKEIDPAFTHDPSKDYGALVLVSKDKGATWTQRGNARLKDSTFDEHMFIERNNDDIWMLVRTRYGIGQAVSHDGGVTWPEHGPSGIPHTSARFFITRLISGNLLLVRHAPPGKQRRSHLSAFISKDDGATWEGGLVLDERTAVSYPDGLQTKDGLIYITYDFERTDSMHILMTTFTEADVMAGKYASEHARERVLINQAPKSKPIAEETKN